MDKKTLIKEAYEKYIKYDPIISKYRYGSIWISGSTTKVYPAAMWVESGEIRIQLSTHRNMFKKRIEKIVKASNGLLIDGYFCKNDRSCPDELVFYTNWSWLAEIRNRENNK